MCWRLQIGSELFTIARLIVASVNRVSPNQVREFLVTRYSRTISELGCEPFEIPDTFDFFLSGVIDSFGILEMIISIEKEFRIQLDMATLDAEQITVLGPLSRYVAESAKPA